MEAAVIILVNQLQGEIDFLWYLFPGLTFPVIVFLIATACAIWVCRRYAGGMKDGS